MKKGKLKFTPLVEAKERLLAFILGYHDENGYAPTLDEMSIKLSEFSGYRLSRERIRQILQVLVDEGRIKTNYYEWRGTRIVEKPS